MTTSGAASKKFVNSFKAIGTISCSSHSSLRLIVFGNGTSTDIPSVAATSSRSLGFTQFPTNVNGGLCNFLVVANIYYQNRVMAKCEEISAYNSVYDLYERVVWRRANPVALLVAFHSLHEHLSLYLTTQL